jgi:hypothetical protein
MYPNILFLTGNFYANVLEPLPWKCFLNIWFFEPKRRGFFEMINNKMVEWSSIRTSCNSTRWMYFKIFKNWMFIVWMLKSEFLEIHERNLKLLSEIL